MGKPKRPPVHRPHAPKVKPVPQKCSWFATTPAYGCERSGYRREGDVVLCDLHARAEAMDPVDWPANVRRVR